MSLLPLKLTLDQLSTRWSSILNPIVSNPSNNRSVLKNVSLATGTNTINHLLSKPLQGWNVVRQRAAASIHDIQDSNPSPQLTLLLVSSAPVTIDLEVY